MKKSVGILAMPLWDAACAATLPYGEAKKFTRQFSSKSPPRWGYTSFVKRAVLYASKAPAQHLDAPPERLLSKDQCVAELQSLSLKLARKFNLSAFDAYLKLAAPIPLDVFPLKRKFLVVRGDLALKVAAPALRMLGGRIELMSFQSRKNFKGDAQALAYVATALFKKYAETGEFPGAVPSIYDLRDDENGNRNPELLLYKPDMLMSPEAFTRATEQLTQIITELQAEGVSIPLSKRGPSAQIEMYE